MKTKRFAFAVCWLTVALMLPSTGRTASAPQRILPDSSSFANVGAFVTRHLVLDLTANFERRTLAGTAELRLERRDARAKELVLDTRDLTVKKVEAATGTNHWVRTEFNLDPSMAAFGSALRIVMPLDADRVRITYATSPEARGLQWLTPAQTADKRHPFLFSNPFAINARSFIPLQDLPGVRTTYEATLRVPAEFVALMAAERLTNSAQKGLFKFRIEEWLTTETIPATAVLPRSESFAKVEQARDAWLAGGKVDALASSAKRWSIPEWRHFVNGLPRTLSRGQMRTLDDRLHLTQSKNFQLTRDWLKLVIATQYEPAYDALEKFLLLEGRVTTLYRVLASTAVGKARAREIFAKARESYHPIVQTEVEELLRP